MKNTLGSILLGVACTLGLASSAVAAPFSFSYTFEDGQSLSATIEGDMDPDTPGMLINLRNLHAVYSGLPDVIFDTIQPVSAFGPATLKVDDSNPSNWHFQAFADPFDSPTPNYGFLLNQPAAVILGSFLADTEGPFLIGILQQGPFEPSRYAIEQTAPTPVPEPTTLALLSLPLLHAFARRRRLQRT
jgi:hypothetical protein